MPTYQPGDVLRDKGGYPVIIHYGEGASTWCASTYETFKRALDGEITIQEYVGIVASHVDVELAYRFGGELPEGATVTHEPELAEGLLQER